MKCLTYNCNNQTHEGEGMWLGSRWVCMPCYVFLTEGVGCDNQIVKNTKGLDKHGTVFLRADSKPLYKETK